MHFKRRCILSGVTAALVTLSSQARAVISSNPAPYSGITINTYLGADTFYNNGYLGFGATVANIEGGYSWNGHETLEQVNTYLHDPSITGEFDAHATAVGAVIAGSRPLFSPLYYHQAGIAPYATLWSGAIATSFGPGGSFDLTEASFTSPYITAMKTGVGAEHATADVINSSWANDSEADGNSYFSKTLDGLAASTGKTVVIAAGNSGPFPNSVNSPASGMNLISVGALSSDTTTPAYSTVSHFSSRGPNDFFVPTSLDGSTGTVLSAVRAPVDIAAPGENLVIAYYGGTTGGNLSGSDPSSGATDWYQINAAGTSFAAPIVAGGAALVVDAGRFLYAGNELAVDGRVVKAVLMNSAARDSSRLVGWDNVQHVNGSGVIETTQSLDNASGAGRLDLAQAYAQYTAPGTHDLTGLGGGTVFPRGWDYGAVAQNSPIDYRIDRLLAGGSTFDVTLDWFDNTKFDTATLTPTFGSFDNLDLEVWSANASGQLLNLIAESDSVYNNVELLSFTLPTDGYYTIRVKWTGEVYDLINAPNFDTYGLAWNAVAVPEPGMISMIAVGGLVMLRRRPRRS